MGALVGVGETGAAIVGMVGVLVAGTGVAVAGTGVGVEPEQAAANMVNVAKNRATKGIDAQR